MEIFAPAVISFNNFVSSENYCGLGYSATMIVILQDKLRSMITSSLQ